MTFLILFCPLERMSGWVGTFIFPLAWAKDVLAFQPGLALWLLLLWTWHCQTSQVFRGGNLLRNISKSLCWTYLYGEFYMWQDGLSVSRTIV